MLTSTARSGPRAAESMSCPHRLASSGKACDHHHHGLQYRRHSQSIHMHPFPDQKDCCKVQSCPAITLEIANAAGVHINASLQQRLQAPARFAATGCWINKEALLCSHGRSHQCLRAGWIGAQGQLAVMQSSRGCIQRFGLPLCSRTQRPGSEVSPQSPLVYQRYEWIEGLHWSPCGQERLAHATRHDYPLPLTAWPSPASHSRRLPPHPRIA